MRSEDECFSSMLVENGIIREMYPADPAKVKGARVVDLKGMHVYPCLIDGHTHMLYTIVSMATGFNICEITPDGVIPGNMAGIEKRLREYAANQSSDAIIAATNYIITAIEERRMPSRQELDDWAGGRAVVIYNIDGHSSSLSSRMLELTGIEDVNGDGILSGEAHEKNQGRITETIGAKVSLKEMARGIACFQNACASYGISVVGALEGYGDAEEDKTTGLIVRLARHFEIGVRFYFQYWDITKAERFTKFQKHKRIGGCGDWEMDGAVGSHTAAFGVPYADTGKTSPCYYEQDEVDREVARADKDGFQIGAHAIGELAINRIIEALDKCDNRVMHRIEHCEFFDDDAFRKLREGKYAVMVQPGYSWIDKRYLNTYSQYLPQEILERMKLRSLYEAGVCLCGSSDSPVQDIDPYMQMLGMVDFYNEKESITPYEAMCCYTKNPAAAILEAGERGTLEAGKVADFFTADKDFFTLSPMEIREFRPSATYYKGRQYRAKSEIVWSLIRMLLTKPKKV